MARESKARMLSLLEKITRIIGKIVNYSNPKYLLL